MYDPLRSLNAFQAGTDQRKARETEAGRMKIGNAFATGDYTGAANTAYGMGDLSTGMEISQYGKGLEDAAAEEKRVGLIKYGMGLLQTPAEQRESMRPQITQALTTMGIPLDEQSAAGMDLSDEGIKATLMTLQDTDGLMKMYQAQMAPPKYGAPVEALGPDNKPAYVQWSETGQSKAMEGYTPPGAQTKYSFEQIGNEIYAINPADPADKVLVGAAPPKSPLVTVNNGDGPQETAFMKKAGELEAQNFASIVEMGQTARRNRVTLDQLDVAAASTPGGMEAVAKRALGNLGINTEGLTEIQATEALINQLVPAQRPAGSGPMSDRDLALFKASLPRLIQTPEGRAEILNNIKAINNYVLQEGEISSRVLSGQITPQDGRAELDALGNPLAGKAASTRLKWNTAKGDFE